MKEKTRSERGSDFQVASEVGAEKSPSLASLRSRSQKRCGHRFPCGFAFSLSTILYPLSTIHYSLSSILYPLSVILSLSASAATQITSSTAGSVLTEGYYEVPKSVTLKGATGKAGLSVAENSTVSIYIPNGITLTLQGAKASGTTPGYPGLEIPSSSTVILVGKGALSATGGDGGEATDGKDGADYKWDFGNDHTTIAGKGGDGGIGAAGAAAAIGGRGGNGGAYGAGGAEGKSTDKYPNFHGNDGSGGGAGGNGGTMGSLYVLDAISVDASPGENPVVSGMKGLMGNRLDNYEHIGDGVWWRYGIGGGGGGGGGGCVTNNAAAIGGGVPGGGGGGGGGGGATDNVTIAGSVYGGTGGGGKGGANNGQDSEPTNHYWTKGDDKPDSDPDHKGYHGGNGGSAGTAGSRGGDGKLYVSQEADVRDRIADGSAEMHDFLYRQVTFDYQGGTLRGASSATRDAYLYLLMPDAPVPSKDGCVMTGYFTQPGGNGTKYYEADGEPLFDYWNNESQSVVLYAAWRECSPPPHALLVTKLGDEAFDPDSSDITFRAALNWAMLFPDLVGEDGTPSKVTFDEKLWKNKESISIYITAGKIRIGESRFTTDHPMIVAGPSMETCNIVIDAKNSHVAESILYIGEGNTVEITDLIFQNATSEDEGGAIMTKADELRIKNCVFNSNVSATSGGAVYGGEGGHVKVENCRFYKNTSNSTTQGGGAIYGGKRLTVVNSSFLDNEASYGGAIYAAATSLVVNASIFRNSAHKTGGGIYSGGSNDTVAVLNCTVNANIADCQEGTVEGSDGGGGLYADASGPDSHVTIVNDFFIGNRQTALKRPDVEFGITNAVSNLIVRTSMFGTTSDQIEEIKLLNVRTGKKELEFFETGERGLTYRELEKRGITHEYLRTMDTVGDYGCPIFYDDNWENVAFRFGVNAAKTAILGDPNVATNLLFEDISTRLLAELCQNPQCGSYWFVHDHPEWGTVVTTIEDVDDWYDGLLSLREIIDGIARDEENWATNRENGVYTITFDPRLIGQTNYLLGAQCDVYGTVNASNETGNVNIIVDGGTNRITIVGSEGSSPYRAFRVMRGSSLTLRNLTIANCTGTPLGQEPMPGYDGGALLNQGTSVVERCTFENCTGGPTADNPAGFGGALCNGPMASNIVCSLTVRDSVFKCCRAAQGGAVYNYPSNALSLTGCTFDGNSANPGQSSVFVAAGGAAYNGEGAALEITGCTFTNNTIVLDGEELPNDIYGKAAEPHYTVSCLGAAVSKVALNAAALPDEESVALDTATSATMPDGTPAVTMSPTGLTPGLSYALGYSAELGASFKASEGTWVRANAQGRLDEPLRAPAGAGSGFYKVFVRE